MKKTLGQNGLNFIASKFKELRDSLTSKVDKVTGKDLSTNDYTNEAKAKVDAIPENPKYTDTIQDLSGYAKKDDIKASKVIEHYELDKDFWVALQNDTNFLEAVGRDMFTLVSFKGEKAYDLAEQAGFETILYYKSQPVGDVSLIGVTYDGIENDIKGDTLVSNGFLITYKILSKYNSVIQNQLKELSTATSSIPKSLSQLTDDATHRLVTDAEKTTWSEKVNNDQLFVRESYKEQKKKYGDEKLIPTVKSTLDGFNGLEKSIRSWAINFITGQLKNYKQQVILTQSQYDALSSTDKNDASKIYFIKE